MQRGLKKLFGPPQTLLQESALDEHRRSVLEDLVLPLAVRPPLRENGARGAVRAEDLS